MKMNKRIFAVILSILMIICSALSVTANDSIALTISCKDKKVPLCGVGFEIFLVAEEDRYGELTVSDNFKKYNVELDSRSLAYTLEGFVRHDALEPYAKVSSNIEGYAVFDGLSAGLYLVIADRHTQNGKIYDFAPFTVLLEDNLTVNAKFDSEDVPKEDDTVNRKVLKVWDDEGFEAERPREIVVYLLKDGKVYDKIVLNEENNWRYTWKGLDPNSKWTVAEDEIDGYVVTITQEGITFVITNKHSEPDEPDDTTDTTGNDDTTEAPPDDTTNYEDTTAVSTELETTVDTVTDNETDSTSDSSSVADTTSVPDENAPILPQTGQIWWPVPLFTAVGLAFIVAGIICLRGVFRDEKS